jgi:hypothetical protein
MTLVDASIVSTGTLRGAQTLDTHFIVQKCIGSADSIFIDLSDPECSTNVVVRDREQLKPPPYTPPPGFIRWKELHHY